MIPEVKTHFSQILTYCAPVRAKTNINMRRIARNWDVKFAEEFVRNHFMLVRIERKGIFPLFWSKLRHEADASGDVFRAQFRKSAELELGLRRWFCREMGARGHSWDWGGTRGIQHSAPASESGLLCNCCVTITQGKSSSNSYIAPLTVVTRWGICYLKICVVSETWWDGQEARSHVRDPGSNTVIRPLECGQAGPGTGRELWLWDQARGRGDQA